MSALIGDVLYTQDLKVTNINCCNGLRVDRIDLLRINLEGSLKINTTDNKKSENSISTYVMPAVRGYCYPNPEPGSCETSINTRSYRGFD